MATSFMRSNYSQPWESIATDISNEATVAQALENAGLLFTVDVREAYFVKSRKETAFYEKAPGHNFIVRTDTYEVLGHCKERFVPLQNSFMVDIVQPLLDTGKGKLQTAGLFNRGEKVWILVELDGYTFSIASDSDTIKYHLLLVNGHDGSTSVQMGVFPIRFFCTNMLPMLSRSMIKFKHTENVEEMLLFFKLKLTERLRETEKFATVLRSLVNKNCSSEDYTKYVKELFSLTETTHGKNKLQKLQELFVNGRGLGDVQGTWYAAFNAVAEYLSYEAGNRPDSRLTSLWFGANGVTLNKALDYAVGV